jgi:hypothetical protein
MRRGSHLLDNEAVEALREALAHIGDALQPSDSILSWYVATARTTLKPAWTGSADERGLVILRPGTASWHVVYLKGNSFAGYQFSHARVCANEEQSALTTAIETDTHDARHDPRWLSVPALGFEGIWLKPRDRQHAEFVVVEGGLLFYVAPHRALPLEEMEQAVSACVRQTGTA